MQDLNALQISLLIVVIAGCLSFFRLIGAACRGYVIRQQAEADNRRTFMNHTIFNDERADALLQTYVASKTTETPVWLVKEAKETFYQMYAEKEAKS